MRYYLKQLRPTDCGFICLKIILGNYVNGDYLFLKDEKKSNYSLLDLKTIAKNYNLKLDGYKISNWELISDKTPFIAHVQMSDKNHFVIVETIKKNKVNVYDPTWGHIKYKKEKWLEVASGNVVLMGEKRKMIKTRISIISGLHLHFSLFLHILEFSFIIIALYFINSMNVFTILIAFFLALGCEFVVSNYNIRSMKQFDQKFELNYDNIEAFSNAKKNLFLSNDNIFMSGISIITILLLVFINNLGIFCTFLGVLGFIILFFFLDEKENKRIECKEKMERIEKMIDLSYKIVKKRNIRQYMMLFLVSILFIFDMMLNKVFTLNYFMFYFGLFMLFVKQVQLFLKTITIKNDYLDSLNAFYDK